MLNIEGIPDSVKIDYTGQLEKQNKEQAFLMGAFFSGSGINFSDFNFSI